MTLKRLSILVGILVLLLGGGIAWLWPVAYSPQGKARVIVAQLRGDYSGMRGWLLKHGLAHGFDPPIVPTGRMLLMEDVQKKTAPSIPPPANTRERAEYDMLARQAASEAMAALGSKALPVMIETLQDADPSVRLMAIQACGLLRDERAIEPLVKCIREAAVPDETDSDVILPGIYQADLQFESFRALGRIGPKSYAAIRDEIDKCDSSIESRLPEFLFDADHGKTVPGLVELLNSEDNSLRWAAAVKLGSMRFECGPTESLLQHISDRDPWVRVAAIQALRGDKQALPALLRQLRSEHDGKTEVALARTLLDLGSDEGCKHLLATLKSRPVEVRVETAVALGRWGPESLLLPMLQDSDAHVRLAALRAVSSRHDIPAVEKLLNDSDKDVREQAKATLKILRARLCW